MKPAPPLARLDAASLRSLFDRIYVINLPARQDRRKEVAKELAKVGLQTHDPLVHVFPAIRPNDPGEFESVGARGCFMSHLAVLQDALAAGHESILIAEDDMDWTRAALSSEFDVGALFEVNWSFLHGGTGKSTDNRKKTLELIPIPPQQGLQLTHFIAMRAPAIEMAACYLEDMLQRPAGSPQGGPMHVDGAYSWFRKDHPEVRAVVCNPHLAKQRSSRSNVAEAGGWRATRAADHLRAVYRRLRKLSHD